MKNVPEWRFKDDDGNDFPDWQDKKLGEVVTISRGGRLLKKDLSETGTPCILYGELYTTYGDVTEKSFNFTNVKKNLVFSRADDVIMPLSGETPEDISTATCVLLDGVAYGTDLLVLRSLGETDGKFMSFLINGTLKFKIARIAQGRAIVHIKADDIKDISVKIPCLEEQKKIGEYFFTLDKGIAAQENKLHHWQIVKKALLQKIFSREWRFKDDEGNDFPDWQEKILSDVADVFDGTHQTPKYTDSGIKFVSVENINDLYASNKYISVEDFNKNYKVYPQKGDVLMTRIGDIGTPAIVSTDEKLAFYVSLALLKPKKDILSEYLLAAVGGKFFQRELRDRSLQNAYPKKINKQEIGKCKIKVPCLEEQKKIGEYFTCLDKLIDTENKTLNALRTMKKGLLQKMFV